MKLPNLETYLVATTVSDGSGKFHPGLKHGLNIFYWPNIKHGTEDDAETAAKAALNDALEAANTVISEWNVVSLT